MGEDNQKVDDESIDSRLMDLWINLAQDVKSKEQCNKVASHFDELAQFYAGVVKHYEDKAERYRRLRATAEDAAAANRKLANDGCNTAT